jgi:hypothetical protein
MKNEYGFIAFLALKIKLFELILFSPHDENNT